MMRYLVRAAVAGALAVVSTHVSTASAQSLPNISGIKQTTNRAVAKTNAHTLAMTSVDSAKIATPPGNASPAGKRVESPVDTVHGAGVCARDGRRHARKRRRHGHGRQGHTPPRSV